MRWTAASMCGELMSSKEERMVIGTRNIGAAFAAGCEGGVHVV